MQMLIEPQILTGAGAVLRKYHKGQVVFHEGDPGAVYYQIQCGSISIVNTKEDGSEFIQGVLSEGQPIGIAAVMLEQPYPATAVAGTDVVLYRLDRHDFMTLLQQRPDVLLAVSLALCRKLYNRAFLGKGFSSQGPETRISALLEVLKKESGTPTQHPYQLQLSRQQVANMTGLRVETVIRAMKRLEQKGTLRIERGKVIY